jgi:hypothetical protein
MQKKALFGAVTGVITSLIIAGIAFGYSEIKIFVDGKQIIPDVNPQIINGRTMVPLRYISEALGEKVNWDHASQTVNINSQGKRSLQAEVNQFVHGLAPASPAQALDLYMNGFQYRNASLQYAAFNEALQKQALPQFEKLDWSTGVSSPWVSGWKVTKTTTLSPNQLLYEISCLTATSTGPFDPIVLQLEITKQNDEHWFITSVKTEQELPRNISTKKIGESNSQ